MRSSYKRSPLSDFPNIVSSTNASAPREWGLFVIGSRNVILSSGSSLSIAFKRITMKASQAAGDALLPWPVPNRGSDTSLGNILQRFREQSSRRSSASNGVPQQWLQRFGREMYLLVTNNLPHQAILIHVIVLICTSSWCLSMHLCACPSVFSSYRWRCGSCSSHDPSAAKTTWHCFKRLSYFWSSVVQELYHLNQPT